MENQVPDLKPTSSVHTEHAGHLKDAGIAQPARQENLPDGYYPQTDEEKHLSRSLNRKLDLFLLPFLSLLYLFNGLDRGNVGNAQTQGELPRLTE
jgi:hypothetical protein